ncbi:MAG: hypothetical protein KAY24_06175 [Candidatus Eisenbacteria sp.]|nr:hypothetical protein [Candidatus Eisenbacteria bacterium]
MELGVRSNCLALRRYQGVTAFSRSRAVPAIQEAGALLGGETGAALLTRGFRPARAVIHMGAGDAPAMARDLGLIPDPRGNVTLLKTFGERNGWNEGPKWCALRRSIIAARGIGYGIRREVGTHKQHIA